MWRALKSNWLVLPAVALIAAAACLAGLEVGARILFPQQVAELCQLPSGAQRANCSFRLKPVEGPWVTETFNSCGSRSTHPCDIHPSGNRVVVLGDSVVRGYGVRYEDMFAPRAEAMLNRICSTPTEFQNLSLAWPVSPDDKAWADATSVARKAASLRPNVILLFVTQWDMYEYGDPKVLSPPRRHQASTLLRAISAANDGVQGIIDAKIKHLRDTSHFVLIMRRFLSRRDQAYLMVYGAGTDLADYLRPVPTPAWIARVSMVMRFAAPIASEAARVGAHFAVVYIAPEPPILLARGLAIDANDDPYALSTALEGAVSSQGWRFIDTLPAFAARGTPTRQYYRINGHPNPAGHASIARALVDSLAGDHGFCGQPGGKAPTERAAVKN